MNLRVNTIEMIEILLVEDNLGDVRLTVEALKEAKIPNHLSVVNDGVEAINFLKKTGNYQNAPRPHLILLDLNLPKKDGKEVLSQIKSDNDLKSIPVIVLSTTTAQLDIESIYNLHANCFIAKPVDLDDFMSVMKAIEFFWFSIVNLPVKK